MSSSSSIADLITSVLSRPNECSVNSIEFEQSYDVKLAFALTGLDRSDLFSPFFPLHRLIASKLIDYFISIENLSELEKIARFGREKVNPNLFSYAFIVAILNRSDTKNALLYSMSPAKMFPDKFFPASTILNAITELNAVPESARVRHNICILGESKVFELFNYFVATNRCGDNNKRDLSRSSFGVLSAWPWLECWLLLLVGNTSIRSCSQWNCRFGSMWWTMVLFSSANYRTLQCWTPLQWSFVRCTADKFRWTNSRRDLPKFDHTKCSPFMGATLRRHLSWRFVSAIRGIDSQ